jgi:hypothetical protein
MIKVASVRKPKHFADASRDAGGKPQWKKKSKRLMQTVFGP